MILRIRQSLIGSWQYAVESGEPTKYQEFLDALSGKEWGGNEYTAAGNAFENAVTDILAGKTPTGWVPESAYLAAEHLRGAVLQVHLRKKITVGGIEFLLDGTLDALKAGDIFDTKYSKTYTKRYPARLNYYVNSPQHPMYFRLEPKAKKFTYLICDEDNLYREWYHPDECPPIDAYIREFMGYLETTGNMQTYINNWRIDK